MSSKQDAFPAIWLIWFGIRFSS